LSILSTPVCDSELVTREGRGCEGWVGKVRQLDGGGLWM